MDVSSSPATIGSVLSPDTVADTVDELHEWWQERQRAEIANPTMNDSMQHTVNTGLRNSRIGRIGSAAWLSTIRRLQRRATDETAA